MMTLPVVRIWAALSLLDIPLCFVRSFRQLVIRSGSIGRPAGSTSRNPGLDRHRRVHRRGQQDRSGSIKRLAINARAVVSRRRIQRVDTDGIVLVDDRQNSVGEKEINVLRAFRYRSVNRSDAVRRTCAECFIRPGPLRRFASVFRWRRSPGAWDVRSGVYQTNPHYRHGRS